MQIMTECDVDRHDSLTGSKESHPFATTYLEINSFPLFSYSLFQVHLAAAWPRGLTYMRQKLTTCNVCFDFHDTE